MRVWRPRNAKPSPSSRRKASISRKDGVFQILFEVAVLEAEEVEDVGVAENEVGRELVLAAERGELGFGNFFGLLRDSGALEEHGVDFLGECAGAPAFNAAHFGVEVALEFVRERDDRSEVGPAQLCTQCVHNLRIGKDLGESDHIEEVPTPKTSSKLSRQLCTQ